MSSSWNKALSFILSLWIMAPYSLANSAPMEPCQLVLSSDGDRDLLTQLRALFDSENQEAQSNMRLMGTVLETIGHSPLNELQSKIKGHFTDRTLLKKMMLFGPLSHWAITPQLTIEKPIDVLRRMTTRAHDFSEQLEPLNQYEVKVINLIELQHQHLERNAKLGDEINQTLKDIVAEKEDFDRLVNMHPRELTTKKYVEAKVEELQQTLLTINKRTKSLKTQIGQLELQTQLISETRRNLTSIINSEIPSLLATTPPALALQLQNSPPRLANKTSAPSEIEIPFGGGKFKFDGRTYDSVLLVKRFQDFTTPIIHKILTFPMDASSLDSKLTDNKRGFLIDAFWNYFYNEFHAYRYDIRNGRTTYGRDKLILNNGKNGFFYVVDVDKKTKNILGYSQKNMRIEVLNLSQLTLLASTKITRMALIKSQSEAQLVQIVGFNPEGKFIYQTPHNPNQYLLEDEIELVPFSENEQDAETAQLINSLPPEKIVQTASDIVHPNAFNIKVSSFIGGININNHWGSRLKNILNRLGNNKIVSLNERIIELDPFSARQVHPYQHNDEIDEWISSKSLFPLFNFFGEVVSVTESSLFVRRTTGKLIQVGTSLPEDKQNPSKIIPIDLNRFLTFRVAIGELTSSGRFNTGENFSGPEGSTYRVLSHFKINDKPYLLLYHFRIKPEDVKPYDYPHDEFFHLVLMEEREL